MNVTPRTVIHDAYRALGVLRPGQGVSEDSVDEALRLLNEMIDSWQLERLMIYGVEGVSHTIPSAGGSFSLGPGGTLAQTAPVRVEGAGWIRTGYPEETLDILTLDQYRRQYPGVYLDGKYPLTTLYINPAALGGETLVLYTWQQITGFTSADIPVNFAPGYARALRWCLAQELIPAATIQQKIPNPTLANIIAHAAESKGWIKSFHSSPPPVMRTDGLGCGCGYNICTDNY